MKTIFIFYQKIIKQFQNVNKVENMKKDEKPWQRWRRMEIPENLAEGHPT